MVQQTVGDQNEYPLSVPDQATFSAIRWAKFSHGSEEPYRLMSINPRSIDKSVSRPTQFYRKGDDAIVLNVGKEGELITSLVLIPSRKFTELPAEETERWFEYIRAGALHRLMMVPGKAWSNLEVAAYYRSVFEAGITRARRYGSRAGERVSRTVSYGGV